MEIAGVCLSPFISATVLGVPAVDELRPFYVETMRSADVSRIPSSCLRPRYLLFYGVRSAPGLGLIRQATTVDEVVVDTGTGSSRHLPPFPGSTGDVLCVANHPRCRESPSLSPCHLSPTQGHLDTVFQLPYIQVYVRQKGGNAFHVGFHPGCTENIFLWVPLTVRSLQGVSPGQRTVGDCLWSRACCTR